MGYVALYRAYRPQKFSDVVGQQHIIKTLQNAIKLNKVAHAYLFCGPRGTGKTSLAKIVAKALNCVEGPKIEPCDSCEICQGIQKGVVADVVEIDAASNNGADDIRALRDSVKYMPTNGKYKVYIIDEVHMLSTAAFNALLKTLEEPPNYVIFILATTEPYKLPSTILSRCQRFDFQSLSIEDISKRLKNVSMNENISITEEAIHQIASSAEGGMRDALSLFDQIISFSTNSTISLEDVLMVSGNVGYKDILRILDFCLDGNSIEALKKIDSILREGKEVPKIINDLILFLRDVLLFKNDAVLIEHIEFQSDDFKQFSKKISKKIIYEWLNYLNETNNTMRFSNQKRAYLELVILKMADLKLNEEINLLERIDQLEQTIQMISLSKKESPAEPIEPMKINIPTKEEIEQIQTTKQAIVEPLKQANENLTFNEDEVQIEEIEEILNSASKQRKLQLQEILKKIAIEYSSKAIAQILIHGEVVAVNENKMIIALNDLGYCNRLMLYENFIKIIEIFTSFDANIQDYICIPKGIWNKIRVDYLSKYNENAQAKIQLEKIRIGVLKRVEPKQIDKKDETYERLSLLVDKEKIEILEE